jgi:hypothetical protein
MKIRISSHDSSQPIWSDTSARIEVCRLLNEAINIDNFFKVNNEKRSIEFSSFARHTITQVLFAVLLVCQEDVYFQSAYSPHQGIVPFRRDAWIQARAKLERFNLREIEVTVG